jgi:hypothetical protein
MDHEKYAAHLTKYAACIKESADVNKKINKLNLEMVAVYKQKYYIELRKNKIK